MNYWQVAAGDGGRDYSTVFLKYGVCLIGPGDPGDYFENIDYYQNVYVPNDITYFAENVRDGDIVVLKRPSRRRWEVIAVGFVKTDYEHLSVFDDVEGWDLQHTRFVDWQIPSENESIISGLRRGTFFGIELKSTKEKIDQIFKDSTRIKPKDLPKPTNKLTDEELIEELINYGLRPKDSEDFTKTILRIRRLVKWYYRLGKDVSEHETRTFLIIPLLMALGWSEQKLKIEWRNIDIAFFDKPYSRNEINCIIILESKRLWEGLTYATNQVKYYANKYPNCDRLIVSNGCCYKLFSRKNGHWVYSAYLNILKPKQFHPYEDGVGGAIDVFINIMSK